jgi:ElaB/YqjD/DUF883 family membrane-anchored ribosome-binding protein
MIAPVRDLSSNTAASGTSDEASTLAELRATVNEIASELSDVAEKRTRAAREHAEAGAQALRGTIRSQPVIAMGVAAVAGALLAVMVVPRSRPSPSSRDSWAGWTPSMPVSRADLYDVADSIQRSVSRAASAAQSIPVSSSLERFVDAISRVEPNASLNSALEKAGGWFRKAQERAESVVKK